jgi:hypothetical protein
MRSLQFLARPIFRQRRIAASTANLCYAKIAPAVLQRGDFTDRRRKRAEAAGGRP